MSTKTASGTNTPSTTKGLSRRELFRTSAKAAALGGVGALALQAAPASARPKGHTVRPGAPDQLAGIDFVPTDPNLHLLRRATFGITPQLQKQITKMGRTAWINKQLAPETIPDPVVDDLLASRFPGLAWTIPQALDNLEEFSWDLMQDLGIAAIARAAWSKRQLFEVMVDFWSNHLNVTNPHDDAWANRHDYDRNVIRKFALGKFSDMLAASVQHPAMMTYLNNAESTKYDPNENYGRELLELHSVGVLAGYTETDMWNSTLMMTGFGINWDTYQFKYYPSYHHTGQLKIMGHTSANSSATNGQTAGLAYVDYLAHHPATASRIATKLCERFVSDTPPPALVSALAATYLANDTDIKPVLRQLFNAADFASSTGQKVRRPMEALVATIRTLGIKADVSGRQGMQALYWIVDDMGQAPLAWVQPDGYPDRADSWRSAGGTLARWNTNMSLAAHWWPQQLVLPPLRNLLPRVLPTTYGGYVDALVTRLVQRTFPTAHRDAVCAFLGKNAASPLKATDPALGWRFPYVVSLILDTPYHQVR